MRASPLHSEFIDSIEAIDSEAWNRLVPSDTPFLRHEFLAALERSGSVGQASQEDNGWQPCHFIGRDTSGLLQCVSPNYLKNHSYGEYVFDWAWADAYHQHGYHYYPKMVCAIPFTPTQSKRLLLDAAHENGAEFCSQWVGEFQQRCTDLCKTSNLSSMHVLFPVHEQNFEPWLLRTGMQYHWFNYGYQDFDGFLARLTSKKRKNIRKERAAVDALGLRHCILSGREISAEQLEHFFWLYQSTYFKRGQQGYLNKAFFEELCATMPDALRFLLYYRDEKLIAGALFFLGTETLYGRYWGCLEQYQNLHFEACYYQGIDYCIEHGLKRFDAGAQGEHKLLRGFEPVETRSYHYIAHPDFRRAIADYLDRERKVQQARMEEARSLLPFRQDMTLS